MALCEERHFSRAAKRCGVTQPSMTNAIKRLERTLGGPLFQRNRGNIDLTALGRVVKPYLSQLDRCSYEAKRKAELFLSAPSVVTHPVRPMEAFMRANRVIAVVAALIIGIGAKLYLFPPKQAEAKGFPSFTMNITKMHQEIDIKSLPVQEMSDKSFVFSDKE